MSVGAGEEDLGEKERMRREEMICRRKTTGVEVWRERLLRRAE